MGPLLALAALTLGEPVELRRGQRACSAEPSVCVKLVNLIHSPCPKGVRCFWSGLAIDVELAIGEEPPYRARCEGLSRLCHPTRRPPGRTPQVAPYALRVERTDYKSFARLSVEKTQDPDPPGKPGR